MSINNDDSNFDFQAYQSALFDHEKANPLAHVLFAAVPQTGVPCEHALEAAQAERERDDLRTALTALRRTHDEMTRFADLVCRDNERLRREHEAVRARAFLSWATWVSTVLAAAVGGAVVVEILWRAGL